MNVTDNLKQVLAELPSGVRLVAVSKFHPNEAIEEAYRAGQRIFGESKVQEMTGKYESLPKDIEWHFIGHLQTNKIKYMAPYVSMIHGIDSYKLLAEVNKQAIKAERVIRCLLQIHIAQEETKFGFSFDECKEMLVAIPISPHICMFANAFHSAAFNISLHSSKLKPNLVSS